MADTEQQAQTSEQPVDGFSDNASEQKIEGNPGSPDPGRDPKAPKPLSPEEYAELKKDADKPDVPLSERHSGS